MCRTEVRSGGRSAVARLRWLRHPGKALLFGSVVRLTDRRAPDLGVETR